MLQCEECPYSLLEISEREKEVRGGELRHTYMYVQLVSRGRCVKDYIVVSPTRRLFSMYALQLLLLSEFIVGASAINCRTATKMLVHRGTLSMGRQWLFSPRKSRLEGESQPSYNSASANECRPER